MLELGGKSAHLVFADADVERAATVGGQRDPAERRADLLGRVAAAGRRAGARRAGAAHRRPLRHGVDRPRHRRPRPRPAGVPQAAGPGARLRRVRRGRPTSSSAARSPSPDGITDGAYFTPTLIDGVDPAAPIAQEEIFGPVLTVTPFTTEEEAVALANGTDYALIGAVWTTDLARAHRVAAEVDAGQIYVNTYGAGGGVELPFGGFRKSGYGREKGVEALDAYTATKTIIVQL